MNGNVIQGRICLEPELGSFWLQRLFCRELIHFKGEAFLPNRNAISQKEQSKPFIVFDLLPLTSANINICLQPILCLF